jgi:hypothetical protein
MVSNQKHEGLPEMMIGVEDAGRSVELLTSTMLAGQTLLPRGWSRNRVHYSDVTKGIASAALARCRNAFYCAGEVSTSRS